MCQLYLLWEEDDLGKKNISHAQSKIPEIYVENGAAHKFTIFERDYRRRRENLTTTLYLQWHTLAHTRTLMTKLLFFMEKTRVTSCEITKP